MNIVQELEDLKSFVAGLARTDMEYCTMPPQHGFAEGTTVESVIRKIDKIIDHSKEPDVYTFSTDASINCYALVQYIDSYVESDGPHTKTFINGLYSYLNKINCEIQELKEQSKDPLMIKLKNICENS
jgi:hypothetical protein